MASARTHGTEAADQILPRDKELVRIRQTQCSLIPNSLWRGTVRRCLCWSRLLQRCSVQLIKRERVWWLAVLPHVLHLEQSSDVGVVDLRQFESQRMCSELQVELVQLTFVNTRFADPSSLNDALRALFA